MKILRKTMVVYEVKLSETDLDVAIEDYPKVEKQILRFIKKTAGFDVSTMFSDISISTIVKFSTEENIQSQLAAISAEASIKPKDPEDKPKESETETISPDMNQPDIPDQPDTESKDVIMNPDDMMYNLIKDFKPSPDNKGEED